jgi:hypothetical protein
VSGAGLSRSSSYRSWRSRMEAAHPQGSARVRRENLRCRYWLIPALMPASRFEANVKRVAPIRREGITVSKRQCRRIRLAGLDGKAATDGSARTSLRHGTCHRPDRKPEAALASFYRRNILGDACRFILSKRLDRRCRRPSALWCAGAPAQRQRA